MDTRSTKDRGSHNNWSIFNSFSKLIQRFSGGFKRLILKNEKSHSATEGSEDLVGKRAQFFFGSTLRAAINLQKSLKMDENFYSLVVGYSAGDPKAFYLYGILDEVIKAVTAIVRWEGFLNNSSEDQSSLIAEDSLGQRDHLHRVITEAVMDEQNLWIRKLTEILSDLVLFDSTNTPIHYKLYLTCRQLEAYLGLQKDFSEFFNCENLNAQHSISDMTERIAEIGKSINLKDVWFLNNNFSLHKLGPGQVFESLRTRYRLAATKCTDEQSIALNVSYERAHSGPSRSIHLNVGGPPPEDIPKKVESNIGYVGILCFHIIHQAIKLAGIEPEGDAKFIQELLEDERYEASDMLKSKYKQELEIGDVVFAYGEDLGLVIEKKASSYGYTSYRVSYLTRPPLEEIPEDWWPAPYVHLLLPRKNLKDNLCNILQDAGADSAQIASIQNLTNQELDSKIRKLIKDLERNGLLGSMIEACKRKSETL